MRKNIIVGVVLCAFLSLELAPVINAQTSTPGPTGSATAQVPQYLEFTLKTVKRMSVANGDADPFTQGTDISSSPTFSFGNLVKVTDTNPSSLTFGQFLFMRGEFFYYVLMIAATSGRRYKITESGDQLTGPLGATIPKESVLLVPDYQWLDKLGGVAQGAPPGTAVLGPVASATSGATENLVYQSDNNGLGRLLRSILAISGPPASAPAGVPFNFSLGTNGSTGQGTRQDFTQWKPITQDQPSGSYSGAIRFTLTLN